MKNKINIITTTRFIADGNSIGKYANFNLATYTKDNIEVVKKNHKLLTQKYKLPQLPKFLQQTHSNICLTDNCNKIVGDAIITKKINTICCVLTADCLPIFAYNNKHTIVGVAHAGWQGIICGVIENFIKKFNVAPSDLIIKFGPALSVNFFEVDNDFKQKFISINQDFSTCFTRFNNKYKFDIYKCAKIILNKLGVTKITNSIACTYNDKDKYFSYRRDGEFSGRMANIIYLTK